MKTPASVSDNGKNAKKIAANLLGRLVPMAETQPAFLRGQASRETREILRQKYLLNVARHFEVGFELRILDPQLLRVADKVFFGLLPCFFRGFATGDILDHSLVIQEFTGHFIVHRMRIFRNPDHTPVTAIDL